GHPFGRAFCGIVTRRGVSHKGVVSPDRNDPWGGCEVTECMVIFGVGGIERELAPWVCVDPGIKGDTACLVLGESKSKGPPSGSLEGGRRQRNARLQLTWHNRATGVKCIH